MNIVVPPFNILLVRHGETDWNRDGRYQGRTDISLSSTGEAQVKALSARLAQIPIDIALASPLSRAKATAQAILATRQIHLELEPALVEISHGEWEGKLSTEIERTYGPMFSIWRTAPSAETPAGPGAETLGDVERRAWPVLTALCSRIKPKQTALIVAHDAVNRVLLCKILGLPLSRVWAFRQSAAALNAVSGTAVSDLQIVRLNDSEHSAPLFAETLHRAL